MFLVILALILFVVSFALKNEKSNAAMFITKILRIISPVLAALGIFLSTVEIIESGHVGVKKLFGQIQPDVLREGLNIINPLIDVIEVSVQTQNYTMSSVQDEGKKQGDDAIKVLSKDGLEVSFDITVLYRASEVDAPNILRTIGLDFEEKVVRPIVRARLRDAAVTYNAIELVAEKRSEFELIIRESVEADFKKRGFIFEQFLIRNTNLPQSVKVSIESKINADQDAQRMQFVLTKERQEAERKRVEAQGVADAQKILNEGLSTKILQYEQIKVQKELVNSPNAKIILLGDPKNSPFILGDK
jgi:regulator of protease activity HflC (stomatin/prohibitin superfamily)